MEGGIVEKRADGLGVFQTLSIYVKYSPCLYRRFSPFSAVFLLFSSYLVCRFALFYLSCQSLRLSLVCLALLSAILAETNKLFQLSFKYFHTFHCNILYFIYHHLLILPPYTFPLSIAFFYTTLFPFVSIAHSIIFSFILIVHFCTVSCFLVCSIGTIIQGCIYLSSTIVCDVSRRSSRYILQYYHHHHIPFFVYLYSYTLFCLLYTASV